MNYGYYYSNQRVLSYDRNNPRMNNQNQLVYPTNNIRKVDNHEKDRNYYHYLENENNKGIRKINNNKINPSRFHYQHNNNLGELKMNPKNDEEFNNIPQNENRMNAGYLYNPKVVIVDKTRDSYKKNFNDGNGIDTKDYRNRRERPNHNNNYQGLKGEDYIINNRLQSGNNYHNLNHNGEHINDNYRQKRDENYRDDKFINVNEINVIKKYQNTNSRGDDNNRVKMDDKFYLKKNNYNNNIQNKPKQNYINNNNDIYNKIKENKISNENLNITGNNKINARINNHLNNNQIDQDKYFQNNKRNNGINIHNKNQEAAFRHNHIDKNQVVNKQFINYEKISDNPGKNVLNKDINKNFPKNHNYAPIKLFEKEENKNNLKDKNNIINKYIRKGPEKEAFYGENKKYLNYPEQNITNNLQVINPKVNREENKINKLDIKVDSILEEYKKERENIGYMNYNKQDEAKKRRYFSEDKQGKNNDVDNLLSTRVVLNKFHLNNNQNNNKRVEYYLNYDNDITKKMIEPVLNNKKNNQILVNNYVNVNNNRLDNKLNNNYNKKNNNINNNIQRQNNFNINNNQMNNNNNQMNNNKRFFSPPHQNSN